MGRVIRRILAVLFFLLLAAGVLFMYYKMFINPIPEPSAPPVRATGITTSDRPIAKTTPSASTVVSAKPLPTQTSASASPKTVKRDLSGFVVDYDTGNPVTGISMILLGQETDYFAEAITDAEGEFDFISIPVEAGDNFIVRTASREFYMADEVISIGDKPRFRAVQSATLQGHINDPTSTTSVSDARLAVLVEWEGKDLPFYCSSDNRGDYSLPSLPPGIVKSVVLFSPGFVPQEHVISTAPPRLRRAQAVIHNITVTPGVPISGYVRNADGDQLVGALVFIVVKGDSFNSVRSEELRNKFYYLANTDDKGKFVLPAAPVDGTAFEVVAFVEGYKVGKKLYEGKMLEIELEEGDDPHPLIAP